MKRKGCVCIIGIDFCMYARTKVDFVKEAVTFENLNKGKMQVHEETLVHCSLSEKEGTNLQDVLSTFGVIFSDVPGLAHKSYHAKRL